MKIAHYPRHRFWESNPPLEFTLSNYKTNLTFCDNSPHNFRSSLSGSKPPPICILLPWMYIQANREGGDWVLSIQARLIRTDWFWDRKCNVTQFASPSYTICWRNHCGEQKRKTAARYPGSQPTIAGRMTMYGEGQHRPMWQSASYHFC